MQNWTPYKLPIVNFPNICLFLSNSMLILISIINAFQSSQFKGIKKRNMYYRAVYQQRVYKISSQCVQFSPCNGRKPGKHDDITFLKRFFGVFNCRSLKHFFYSETKLDKIDMFFKDFVVSKFDILNELDLTMGQM